MRAPCGASSVLRRQSPMAEPGYRGRFAPSPTGLLHLGHARTALLAWQRARQAGGIFVLRIEDLDQAHEVEGATQAIIEDLRWLGLDWDEGPDIGGAYGPYLQSERHTHYEEAIAQLTAQGLLYPCTCSRKDIQRIAQAPHGLEELGNPYPGTCRPGVTQPKRPRSLRFRMPESAPPFNDEVYGALTFPTGGWDFVVRRASGLIAYQLAVVVDDAAMGITEVVRGADLAMVTPWQLALYAALGLAPPRFAHVPLMRDADGQRLAKRTGAETLRALRQSGICPKRLRDTLLEDAEALLAPGQCFDPAR